MLRRKHQKSRQGCLECKRRHIKCDENKPACSNCNITERQCSYCGPSPRLSSHTARSSPDTTQSQQPNRLNSSPWSMDGPVDSIAVFGGNINIQHMELLVHFSISLPIPEFNESLRTCTTRLVLDAGLSAPYLLYESLAISARHLATVRPTLSALYLQQASGLQRKAIEMFNSLKVHIDTTNCVSAFLFSSILGRHMLVDVLCTVNSQEGLPLFVEQYIQYVHVHRGVRAVAMEAWPSLLQSELQSLLVWGSGLAKILPRGCELRELSASISASPDLGKDVVEAYLESVRYLQVGVDYLLTPESRRRGMQMVFNWPIMVPIKFVEVLAQNQPEALVVLGHYAALLYFGRDMWQVGNSGVRIPHGVVKYLGSRWVKMLSWPLSVIGSELGDHDTPETSQSTSTVGSPYTSL